MPFSLGFSRTELATTKSAKVTRDNELTSQEEFLLFALKARPRHRRDPERSANIIFLVGASVLTAFVSIRSESAMKLALFADSGTRGNSEQR